MSSVGSQLMQARQARDLCIEDVAFATHIPHQRLRDLENDDLSHFANLTYAKGFLKLYSKFLDLDLSDYLDEFDTDAISDATCHEYALNTSSNRLLSSPAIAPDAIRFRPASALFGAAILVGLLSLGVAIFKLQARSTKETAAAPVSAAGNGSPPGSVSTKTTPPNPAAGVAKAESPAPQASNIPAPRPRNADPVSTTPATIRRATLVDDEGNEIPSTPVRPQS
jgi:cytoskeletal protein RodZ